MVRRMADGTTWRAGGALLVMTAMLGGCGSDDRADGGRPAIEEAGPVHVHGLGVNPRDGALFVATHTGLFRAAPGQAKAERVGDSYQDTMGFAVVGPDRFLGSGHPDGRQKAPPFLGLIRSDDAGKSWRPVSLRGEVDFHVLEAAGARVYGFGSDWETRRPVFLVSDDGGTTWDEREVPEPLVSLAVDPDDADHVLAATDHTLYESADGGRRWSRRGGDPGLLGWREDGTLIRVSPSGGVDASSNGRDWRRAGDVAGQPAAFEVEEGGLYVALHDGTVKRSTDDGRTWEVRSRP
jgi:hypothetical protein